MPKEDLKLVIFILYKLLKVVNVGRSVVILHILPMHTLCVTLSMRLPVMWCPMELL